MAASYRPRLGAHWLNFKINCPTTISTHYITDIYEKDVVPNLKITKFIQIDTSVIITEAGDPAPEARAEWHCPRVECLLHETECDNLKIECQVSKSGRTHAFGFNG